VKTNEKGGKARVKDRPKTTHSRRRINIMPPTVEALRKWKEKTGGKKLVFPARSYRGREERHMLKSSLTKAFKMVLRRAGLPNFRLHDLRHTNATMLLTHGMKLADVSRRLGHAAMDITLRTYAHCMPSSREEEASILAPLLKVQSRYTEQESLTQPFTWLG